MGFIQKDAFRTMLLSYAGLVLGYVNKGLLFVILLSTDEIGLVNLIVAVGYMLAQLANLGSIYAIWKFFPFFRNEAKKHYGFLFMNLIIASVGILLCILAVVLFKHQIGVFYAEKSKLFIDYYYLIVPIGLATVYFLLFENYMRGLNKNIMPVFLNEFLLRILLTVLLVAYSFKWISFDFLLIVYALSHFVPTVILAVYLIKIKELSFSLKTISVPRRFKKIIISFSLYSYFNSIGAIVIITLDAMMLASMVGLKATGIYTTIIYLVSAIQIPYKSLVRISSPLVTLYWKEKKTMQMGTLYKQVSSVCLIIALFLFGIIWINRIHLFSLLPAEYMAGISVFLYLMLGRMLDMYFGLNGTIFVTSKKYKYDLIFTAVLLVVVFVLNLWLIPLYGMVGAAISTAIAFIIYNIGRVIFIYYAFDLHPFEWNQLKVITLFLLLLGGIECFFPQIGNFFWSVGLKSFLFSFLFIFPIIYLKWNTDLNSYMSKGFGFITDKMFPSLKGKKG